MFCEFIDELKRYRWSFVVLGSGIDKSGQCTGEVKEGGVWSFGWR